MTTGNQGSAYRRDREGMGVWEHRGKVAVTGVGHSHMDRRWDGISLDKTLGAYSIVAAQRAIEDAGLSPDDIDGVMSCPGPLGDFWAPRPYFEPPYDSEDGITLVTAEWLIKGMGLSGTPLRNVTYINSEAPQIGEMMGLAAQTVGDGLAKNLLVLYPTGNMEGRYLQSGEAATDYAHKDRQWHSPWGHHTSSMQGTAFVFDQYCTKYSTNHDRHAPFVVNQRRNGLKVPWGFYTLNEPYQIDTEDYLSARWLTKPLNLFDADRPVNASAAYIFSTSDRAKDMKQPPVYVLTHAQIRYPTRSSMPTLNEHEHACELLAQRMWEGSGLEPKDLDVFNPYDGYSLFCHLFLEGFQWHGVKKGESHDFFADDISVEGSHPFNSSGGNLGTGRTRTAIFTDCIDQLRGQAGERQVSIRCETAAAGCNTPGGNGYIMFAKNPD